MRIKNISNHGENQIGYRYSVYYFITIFHEYMSMYLNCKVSIVLFLSSPKCTSGNSVFHIIYESHLHLHCTQNDPFL